MLEPNEVIRRLRQIIPTVEHMKYDIDVVKVFFKLGMNMGFHQLELEADDRNMTTFSTHMVLYQHKINFEISLA